LTLGMLLPRDEFQIDLDGHGLARQVQLIQQSGHRGPLDNLPRLIVDSNLHISPT
jgi:hypothetical protein